MKEVKVMFVSIIYNEYINLHEFKKSPMVQKIFSVHFSHGEAYIGQN